MEGDRVFVGDFTRKQFREGMETDAIKAAIVPTAATEQHDEHLEMIHDTLHVTHIAEQAAQRLYPKVVVATPIAIGVSEHWMEHIGTLTIRPEIFCEYVFDVCNSLKRAGIKNILILNGHGGNVKPLLSRIYEYRDKLKINLRFQSYWDVYDPKLVFSVLENNRLPGHAEEFETSTMRVLAPERVHEKDITNPSAAIGTQKKGEKLIEPAIVGVSEVLRKMIAGKDVDIPPTTFYEGIPKHMITGKPL